jgi:hypothetical protein
MLLACPHCGVKLDLPSYWLGEDYDCPFCGEVFKPVSPAPEKVMINGCQAVRFEGPPPRFEGPTLLDPDGYDDTPPSFEYKLSWKEWFVKYVGWLWD